jgi:hypothetical protein
MQYPANENALLVNPVKDDVLLALDPPIPGPDTITWAAHLRQRSKPLEAFLQSIEVRESLLLAPAVERVIGNLDQVKSGKG